MIDPLDEFSGDDLTPAERKAVRKIMRDQARMDWAWATMRIWVGWVAGSIIGTYAVYEVVLKFVRRWTGS